MGKKWSSVSITGYKAGSPADDGSATEANKVKFSTIYTDLTDPIKTGVDTIVSNLDAVFTQANTATSTNYTTVASDHATWLEVTGTKTITLLAAATATAGYQVGVKNVSTGIVTIARSGADTIDGSTSLTLPPGSASLFSVNQAVDGYTRVTGTNPVEIITSGSVSSAATLDFQNLLLAYRSYKLSFSHLVPASDAVSFTGTLGVGGVLQTGLDYDWVHTTNTDGTGADDGSFDEPGSEDTTLLFLPTSTVGTGAGEDLSGEITIIDPMNTASFTEVHWQISGINASGAYFRTVGAGRYQTVGATDRFQLLMTSGNIATMDYTLYGYRAS